MQLLLATILGCILGISLGEYSLIFGSFGSVLLTIMKMAILPYLCFSILYNLGISKKAKWKKPFKILATTFLALFLLSIPLIYCFTFPYFAEMANQGAKEALNTTWTSSLATGILSSILENAIPWTLLATLLFGFLVIRMKKQTAQKSTKTITETLELVSFSLLKISPIAVVALVASKVGQLNLQDIRLLSSFYLPFILCSLFTTTLLSPYLLRFFSSYHYRTIMKRLATPLLLSLVTGSAFIALPLLIKSLEKLFHENLKNSRIRVLAPIASLVPIWSFLFITLFSSFLLFSFSINTVSQTGALFYSIPSFFVFLFSPMQSMHTLVDTFPLPQSTMAIFLESFSISSSFIALMSTASTFILVSLTELKWKNALTSPFKEWTWKNTAQVSVIGTFVLLIAVYYQPTNNRVEAPLASFKISNEAMSVVHKSLPSEYSLRTKDIDRLEEIKNTNILRVGYSSSTSPFCYYNSKGDLVGFDIAFAHNLASALGATIEFVPLDYATMHKDLEDGLYDIAMSAVTKTEDRKRQMLFSSPVLKIETALTIRSNIQDDDMRNLKKIALLKNTSYEAIGRQIFRPEQIKLVNNYEELLSDQTLQGALWTREEGLAWQQGHQGFYTVKCTPSLGTEAFSYAVSKNSESLAAYIDRWLDIKQTDGFAQEQFEKWILRLPKKNHLR